MTTTIQKWGNSCAVRLPAEVLRKLKLRAGSAVDVREGAKGTLSIVLVPKKNEALKKLVTRISKANQHSAADWGAAVGKEVW